MTEIDFYVLPDETERHPEQFACRLTEKAYRLGHRVFIHTGSAEQTRQLDDLLWTFQQNSFIPHAIYQEAGDTPAPVLLAHNAEPHAGHQVLINLSGEVPLFFSQFERVAELINADSNTRERGRDRYSFYKERGYPLRTHKIKG